MRKIIFDVRTVPSDEEFISHVNRHALCAQYHPSVGPSLH